MNILFLTLLDFESIEEHNIYADLLREFSNDNHNIYVISPTERRKNKDTRLIKNNNVSILKLKIGNTQKTNIIEKGISTIMIESLFIKGIKKYFSNIKFDLIIYSTPPITFYKAIKYLKNRDGAKTYLLLKDIFPQNSLDIGLLNKNGVKGLIYKYFRNKEKKLYKVSDYIGCMSKANVDYVLNHNSFIDPKKVEICPNSVEVVDMSVDTKTRESIRLKYNIPLNKKIFVYGGNLGKPQGIDFLIECLKSQFENKDVFFLIIGNGTERHKLEKFYEENINRNFMLMQSLPKEDYDTLVGACDVGMLFLDHRFTIPNFPSRILSYMQAKVPVLAVTDPNTDVGKVITDGDFGWWCESNSIDEFNKAIMNVENCDLYTLGENGYNYLNNNYTSEKSFNIIMNRMN